MRCALCASLVVLAFASDVVLAQTLLPDPQTVHLRLRENPADPQSAVRYRIFLDLTPITRQGPFVGWRIDTIEFHKTRANDSDVVWALNLPLVPGSDGLWWTKHADPLSPAAGDFVRVPWLIGIADSLDPNYSDLEFDLSGDVYTSPPLDYEATTALTYTLYASAVAEPPVDDSNDDEPVEVPEPTNDPWMAE